MTFSVRINFDGIPLFVTGTFERDGIGIEDLVIESVKVDGLAGREEPPELFDLFDTMLLEDFRFVTAPDGERVKDCRYIRVMDGIESLVAEEIRMG